MANQRVSMQKLQLLIRYTIAGKSQRFIASALGIHRFTVITYQGLLGRHCHQDFVLLEGRSEEELHGIVTLDAQNTTKDELFKLMPSYEKQLAKVGFTKRILWQQHCETSSVLLSYSQFCRLFSQWQGTQKLTMHMEHKAGEKLFIDFAGKKLHITHTDGSQQPVEVFLAVLGYSQLTYCQAVYSQKKEDFIAALTNSLLFFGGVPQAIVPDNLKAAVTKAHRYEAEINDTLADFAQHYNTVIFPTRSHHPKDKALVERTVSIIYQRVYAKLSNRIFYSLNALNEAIRECVLLHNNTNFQSKAETRQMRFEQVERQSLTSLPNTRFELKNYKIAKVHPDCHVRLSEDKHYYSVPYKYAGSMVKIRYTSQIVEIYQDYRRIASHQRMHLIGSYSTKKEHLHPTHQWVKNWSPQSFEKQAEKIGEHTLKAIKQVLLTRKFPEQAYKTCAGILALTSKPEIGKTRLEAACKLALVHDFVSLKLVNGILETNMDTIEIEPITTTKVIPLHPNIRGADYFK